MLSRSKHLMSLSDIEAYNHLNYQRPQCHIYDLRQVATVMLDQQLREEIWQHQFPKEPRFDEWGEMIPNIFYEALRAQINEEGMAQWVNGQYGVAVDNVFVRCFPTYSKNYKCRCGDDLDRFSITLLKFGEPLLIWHYDITGQWCFVQTGQVWGWIAVTQVALVNDDIQWLSYHDERNFLQVIASRIIMTYDDFYGMERDQLLLMGTKIALIDQTCQEYIVSIPQRDPEGHLMMILITVPFHEAFYPGYLPLSQGAIIEQGMKAISEPYGWGGADYYRDCTSLVADIFSTFGFQLARNSTQQRQMASVEPFPINEDLKKMVLESLPVGTVLYFAGHAMIYLGVRDGQHRILHSIYQMGVPIWSELVVHHVKRVMLGHLEQHRANGARFLASISEYWCPFG